MKKVGFTASSFDLLHAGHVMMLKECKENCDVLVVGFNRDPEGKSFVQTEEERLLQLEVIKYVDEVIPYSSEEELLELMKSIQIDVRFLGDDYRERNDFTGAELSIPIFYNDRSHGYSTSELKERTALKSQVYTDLVNKK